MRGIIDRGRTGRLRVVGVLAQLSLGAFVLLWGIALPLWLWRCVQVLSNPYAVPQSAIEIGAITVMSLATLLGVLTFIPAALFFLVWLYFAVDNLHDAGLSGLKARPAWSVASYFVPLANLFVPPGVMRELWNRSHGEDEWQAKAEVGGVSIWWTGFLAGSLILGVLGILALFDGLTNAIVLVPPGANEGMLSFAMLLLCASAASLILLIGRITKAQCNLDNTDLIFA